MPTIRPRRTIQGPASEVQEGTVPTRASRGPRLASGGPPRGFLDDVELLVCPTSGPRPVTTTALAAQLTTPMVVFVLFLHGPTLGGGHLAGRPPRRPAAGVTEAEALSEHAAALARG